MPVELLLEFVPREHISAFQINLFTQCPSRYYETYKEHSRLGSGTKNSAAEFGDVIHQTIDRVSKDTCMIDWKDARVYEHFKYEDVVKIFTETLINYPHLCSEYFLERGKDQLLYWYNAEVEREARIFCTIEFCGSEVPFKLFLPNGVLVMGFIDRVEENKYTKKDEAALVDWKTGYLEEDYSDNMLIYEQAMLFLFEDMRFKCVVHQLQNEHIVRYVFTDEDRHRFNERIVTIREAIIKFAETIQRVLTSGKDEELDAFLTNNAKVNKWCYTCSRRNKCVSYIRTILFGVAGMEGVTDPKLLLDFREQIEVVKKNCDKQVDQIDAILLDFIMQHKDEHNIADVGDGRQLTYEYSSRRFVDASIIVPILIKHGFQARLSIGVTELDKIIKEMKVKQVPAQDLEAIENAVAKKFGKEEKIKVIGKAVENS